MGRPTKEQREKYRLPNWHNASGRWRLRIEHAHGTKEIYFEADERTPEPPPQVIAAAVAVQKHWRDVQSRWDEIQLGLEVADPSKDWMRPVYLTPEQVRDADAKGESYMEDTKRERLKCTAFNAAALGLDELIAALSQPGAFDDRCPPELIEANRVQLLKLLRPATKLSATSTVRNAMKEFLAKSEKRIPLKTERRIESTTHRAARSNLLGTFGLSISPDATEVVRKVPFNSDAELSDVSVAQLETLANYWHGMPEGINSERTVRNYLSAARAFFHWCAEKYGLVFSDATATLFTAGDVKTPAQSFDVDRLKRILAEAKTRGGERLFMYLLFGLLLGYYQSDIARIEMSTYFMQAGENFIHRVRTKERRSKRGGRLIAVKHWVPPELAALIDAERGVNQQGFLFNSEHGTALKAHSVSRVWKRAVDNAEDRLMFKQLRKMGFNRIKFHARSLQVADLWDGHAKGITDSYDDGIFAPVIEAQKAFADELRALGILATTTKAPTVAMVEPVAA